MEASAIRALRACSKSRHGRLSGVALAIRSKSWGSSSASAGADDARVGLGEQDGEPAAVGGQYVALAAERAADEPQTAQTAQVVGHLACRLAGDQAADSGWQGAVGESFEQMATGAQRREQRHHARVAEAQPRGGLTVVGSRRQDDALERRGVGAQAQACSWASSSRWLMSWPIWSSASQFSRVSSRPMLKSRVSLTVVSVRSARPP